MALILVMEDDAAVRGVLKETLERAGHEVVEACDGREGVELYSSWPADLVIADMVMPEKSGWEAILELRRKFGDVKAIGISAGDEMGPFGYLMLAKKFGAKRLLLKPIKRQELLDAVSQVLSGEEIAKSKPGKTPQVSPQRKSALVLDGDPRRLCDLCQGLVSAGHTVTDVQTVHYALEMVRKRSFDVAILDIPTMEHHDGELFGVLRDSWAHTLVVAMADFGAVVARKLATKRGAHHFIGKPVDVDELLDLMFPAHAFMGRLHGFDILEYLQFILQNGKKTVVELKAGPDRFCRLYCAKGDIVHAVSETLLGEEAFLAPWGFTEGLSPLSRGKNQGAAPSPNRASSC
jgi:CheY-like chemotaxis protein